MPFPLENKRLTYPDPTQPFEETDVLDLNISQKAPDFGVPLHGPNSLADESGTNIVFSVIPVYCQPPPVPDSLRLRVTSHSPGDPSITTGDNGDAGFVMIVPIGTLENPLFLHEHLVPDAVVGINFPRFGRNPQLQIGRSAPHGGLGRMIQFFSL
jgi:hypothetical protein